MSKDLTEGWHLQLAAPCAGCVCPGPSTLRCGQAKHLATAWTFTTSVSISAALGPRKEQTGSQF